MDCREGLADPEPKRPLVLRAKTREVDHPRVLTAGEACAAALPVQPERFTDSPADCPPGLADRLGVERQVFHVLLAAAMRFEPDRWDGLAAATACWIEERKRIGLAPGRRSSNRLPGEDAVATERPRIEAPAYRLHVGLLDRVRGAVLDDQLAVAVPAVHHDPAIGAHRAADAVVVDQAVERIALPLRARDIRAEDERAAARSLRHAFVKRRAEVAQGPEVLEVRRLVEQPGRRPARPSALLEVVLPVQEALE